ncbi:MAG TPA: hypothetical protein VFZ65_13060 [Planctomycetota bacterium]|nr:hypothetical protein [Planctomycetota bacterium]
MSSMDREVVRAAARERRLDAELAEVLRVPLASPVGSPGLGERPRSSWLAAAVVLLGLGVAAGVALLHGAGQDAMAQDPAWDDVVDPPYERFEQWLDVDGAALASTAKDADCLRVRLADPADLDRLAGFDRLRALSLTWADGAQKGGLLGEATLRVLTSLPSLDKLYLADGLLCDAGQLRALRTAPRLRELRLQGAALDPALARALVELPRIAHLQLYDGTATAEGIAVLEGLPELTVLELRSVDIDAGVVLAIGRLRTLRVIKLYGTGLATPWLSDAGARAFCELPHLTAVWLRSVTLEAGALAALPKDLTWLGLESVNGVDADALRGVATQLPGLKGLTLRLSQDEIPVAAELVRKLPLQRFRYSGNPSKALWAALAGKASLRALDLKLFSAPPSVLAHVLELPAVERLFVLGGPPAASDLAPLREHPRLRTVDWMLVPPGELPDLGSALGPGIRLRSVWP